MDCIQCLLTLIHIGQIESVEVGFVAYILRAPIHF